MTAKKGQFQARLENQKAQLERHGNFAEVVIRTTPEGTDLINFARMWEHILVTADRQTRGYVAKKSRAEFDKTRDDFDASMKFMIEKIQDSVARHDIDLTGSNFVSRIAQRYGIAKRKKVAKPAVEKAAPKKEVKPAEDQAEQTAEVTATPAVETSTPKAAPPSSEATSTPKPAESSTKTETVDGF